MTTAVVDDELASTGIPGLDAVLRGGLPRDNIYLLQGDPGAGKTTLSMQFLLEGVRRGERALYITLAETKSELEKVARSHGWSIDGISVFEQLVAEEQLRQQETTLYHPAEVELTETVGAMLDAVERLRPHRVVIDSLSEIRLLSQSSHRYRRQILAMKQFFANRNVTVLMLDDRTARDNDLQLHSVPHGVIVLERRAPIYGAPRRRLEVVKLRGVDFRGGYHDFTIVRGGLIVYPRLIAAEHRTSFPVEALGSGLTELDSLIGGGIHRGTSTLILGPAGAGKSALATQYVVAALERGERVAMFVFDESKSTLLARSAGLGLDIAAGIERGLLTIQQIDPAELPPGEFAHLIRDAVEKHHVSLVVIDSLNGYLNAMPEERFLTLHLHELLSYLGQNGVATILVMAQHGMLGAGMVTAVDVSYLADCVILLRYYEAGGQLRKAVSIMKKRCGPHEKSIRDFDMDDSGIRVGAPLSHFRGIMSGIPVTNENDVGGRG